MSRLIFNAVLGGTTTLESTNSADTFLITVPAANGTLSLKDSSGDATFRNITLTGAVLAGAWNGSTITVPYGGTGATTLTGYVKGNGTSAMTASSTIPNTDITGLGTMSTQNANSVTITGGTISGLGTPLAVASGGTGAATLTGYVKGSGTSAMTASATIPNTDITGLGTMSTQNANAVAITGGTISGLGTPLAVASGGTGATSISGLVFGNGTSAMTAASAAQIVSAIGSTYVTNATNATNAVSATTATNIAGGASGAIPYQTGSGATSLLAKGTNGQVLSLVAGLPAWVSVSGAGTVTSVDGSGGTTGLTLTGGPITSSGTLTLGGTLAVANGGTNITSYATGDILYASATDVLSKLAAGSNGQVLTLAAGVPSWAAGATGTVTSVGGTGTVNGLTLTGTVTSSGNLTLGGTLDLSAPPAIGGTTPASGAFTTLTTSANAIISDNSANAALRITQVGAGNALLVEDSANPDSTPTVIDNAGNLILGSTTLASTPSTFVSTIQSHSAANQSLGIGLFNYSTGVAARGDVAFYKSLSGTSGTLSAVSTNTDIGSLNFFGAGGASTWLRAGIILAEVDTGTVSATSMPGRLVFATTADGASSPTERMRITNAGVISLGAAPGSESLRVTPVASAVNYADIRGNVTNGNPLILANGSDTNIGLNLSSKGVSGNLFYTNAGANLQFVVAHTASAVNYLQVTGGATGSAATLSAQGSDSNIELALTPKGTGYVKANAAYSPNLTLSDAATISWDTSTGQVATFTFVSSNRTMGAPTNLKNGAFYALAVIQNGGSNTLTWNSVFKWASGTAPTLSTAAGAKDYFVFRSDGTNLYQQGISQAVA